MLNGDLEFDTETVEQAAEKGPSGAVSLCLASVLIVMGLWLAFYFLAFLPRGILK